VLQKKTNSSAPCHDENLLIRPGRLRHHDKRFSKAEATAKMPALSLTMCHRADIP